MLVVESVITYTTADRCEEWYLGIDTPHDLDAIMKLNMPAWVRLSFSLRYCNATLIVVEWYVWIWQLGFFGKGQECAKLNFVRRVIVKPGK